MNEKKLSMIFPSSVEVIDITYYWHSKDGRLIKSIVAIDGRTYGSGDLVNCYKPIDEEGE